MYRGGFVRGLLLAILLIAVVGGAAYYAYGAGIAQGLLDSGKLTAPVAPIAPYSHYGFHHFGFGAFGCIVPFLFVLFIFALMRGIFGHGHWRWKMHHAHGDHGVPPMFDEWHKRAHEPGSSQPVK